jgi:hypothetical protein
MPVHGRAESEPRGKKALILGALALLWGMGCFFDLDVPTVPATPPPPTIRILAPQQGDTVSLSGQVSVAADSVNGVSTVTLLCGPLDAGARQAYVWATPPYLAVVDFSVCQGLTTPNPDGGRISILQLSAQALSDAGALGTASVQVQLNADAPVLSAQYPPSAQPRSPFTVLVTSNLQLSSLPVVMLAGNAADSITSVPSSGDGGYSYSAYFKSTPGLGTDNYSYDAGVPVPIELLTQTEQLVRLTVEGTLSNGNTSALDLSVDLTRVVWDRFIPGVPAEDSPITWAAEPVAFDGGLVLPLSTTSGGGAASQWIPGVLSSGDGTFSGFDNSLLPDGGLDGGYVAKGINLEGATLFLQVTGRSSNLVLVPPFPSRGAPIGLFRLGAGLPTPLTTVSGGNGVPDLLCEPEVVPQCASGIELIFCYTPDLTPVLVSTPISVFAGPSDAGVAGAGGSYMAPDSARCGGAWNLTNFDAGTITQGPFIDPNGSARDCAIIGLTRVLAVGDGTFVVQLESSCDITGSEEFPILHVDASSNIIGYYTAPMGTQRLVRREVVGVLADGRVVTLTNNPPNTTFELWKQYASTDVSPPADTAQVTTQISGLYDSADATQNSLVARSVYAGADGHFAVLLSGAPFGVGVLAFGPSLQPIWFYLYPRLTTTGTARLVSSPDWGDVYLVDTFNNFAESLRVNPPPQ